MDEVNNIAVYGVFRGRRTGGPVPPTGNRVEADSVSVMQLDGNKIRHLAKVWKDAIRLRKQRGWA